MVADGKVEHYNQYGSGEAFGMPSEEWAQKHDIDREQFLGLKDGMWTLSTLNDSGKTFAEIADIIEYGMDEEEENG